MYKRFLQQIRYFNFLDHYPRMNLGTFLIVLLCSFLIVIATFTTLPLFLLTFPQEAFINPSSFFSNTKSMSEFIIGFPYIPQIPAVLFTGALLGPRAGFLSIVIYVIIGLLGIPVFASGGGINYFLQLGFGYILGYFVGIFIVGNMLSKNITSYSIFRASVIGVLVIHLFGIIYLTCLLLLQHNNLFAVFGWIWALSGKQIFYDLIASFVAICLARPIRSIFWLTMD